MKNVNPMSSICCSATPGRKGIKVKHGANMCELWESSCRFRDELLSPLRARSSAFLHCFLKSPPSVSNHWKCFSQRRFHLVDIRHCWHFFSWLYFQKAALAVWLMASPTWVFFPVLINKLFCSSSRATRNIRHIRNEPALRDVRSV